MENTQLNSLAEKLNPRAHGFSPKLTAVVGAILGFDYGVRDPRGGQLGGLSITSDGFVIAATTSHESGAFIGDATDLERNLDELLNSVTLTAEEHQLYRDAWKAHVQDYR